jgi:hypothetical protein
LKKYPRHQDSFSLITNGIENGIFRPQLHGREHLNVIRWMKALQDKKAMVHLAFKYQMFDFSTSLGYEDVYFMDALNFESEEELTYQKSALLDAAKLFEDIFGYKSLTFIAPCYKWSSHLNETLFQVGITGIQGSWWQLEPVPGNSNRFIKRFHYTGQNNALGQYFIVRNAFFEPSEDPEFDWVGYVMKSAEIAFKLRKPLVISSHRVNYIGFIDQSNRDRTLKLLKELLSRMIKKWPDVEFMSSDRLVELMAKK